MVKNSIKTILFHLKCIEKQEARYFTVTFVIKSPPKNSKFKDGKEKEKLENYILFLFLFSCDIIFLFFVISSKSVAQ